MSPRTERMKDSPVQEVLGRVVRTVVASPPRYAQEVSTVIEVLVVKSLDGDGLKSE